MTGDNNQQVFLSNVASVGYYGEEKKGGDGRGTLPKKGKCMLLDLLTLTHTLFLSL
jgi:hypothetical protein